MLPTNFCGHCKFVKLKIHWDKKNKLVKMSVTWTGRWGVIGSSHNQIFLSLVHPITNISLCVLPFPCLPFSCCLTSYFPEYQHFDMASLSSSCHQDVVTVDVFLQLAFCKYRKLFMFKSCLRMRKWFGFVEDK